MGAPTFQGLEDPYLAFNGYAIDLMWKHLEEWIKHQVEDVAGTDMAPLNLDPDFQRAHVWTEAQQRAFIEYKVRGGRDGGNLLLNCVGWGSTYKGPFELVDGKQRMEAVRKFLRNELAVFDGHFFKDIGGHLPLHCSFRVHINNLPTRERVLRWYLAINTGGTPHTEAEIEKVRELLAETTKGSRR